jgi:hypothetical protein
MNISKPAFSFSSNDSIGIFDKFVKTKSQEIMTIKANFMNWFIKSI